MIPVLVAWRSDGGQRERIWSYLQTHYWAQQSEYKIVEGASPDGPFNRSAALNAAASAAQDWDIAVITDADTWTPAHNLDAAVAEARKTGKLVAAFNYVLELTKDCTDAILDGTDTLADWDIRNIRTDPRLTRSSMLAVTRQLWDRVGGFDPRFEGWGGDDDAFWLSCRALTREPHRIPGPAFHLWHEIASNRDTPQYRLNLRRWQRYTRARNEAQLQQIRAQ